jgi:hypothetical protein
MRNRLVTCLLVAGVALLGSADTARAQQTLNLSLGYFTPRGEDARAQGDVLNENLTFLTFDLSEFNGASVGAEWLMPFGEYVEGGIGISFSRRTVASVYTDYIDDDGTEIDQDLRLRLVPLAFTIRLTPLGRASVVQPYVGAGLGIVNWRYSESGEFVDFGAGGMIFRDQFVANGSQVGPVVVGGIRFGSDTVSAGGEVRYHAAEADLDEGLFAGPRIDLGGWTYNVTVGYRF